MGFRESLKFWVKDTLQSRGGTVKHDSSVSKTLNETSSVGFGGGHSGGLGPTEDAIKQALEGHENYRRSFKENE